MKPKMKAFYTNFGLKTWITAFRLSRQRKVDSYSRRDMLARQTCKG